MKPEDPLAQNFDIPFLAGEALREEDAKQVVGSLDKFFEAGQPELVVAGNGLEYLDQSMSSLVSGHLFHAESTEMSKPYEQFDHSGVNMVSRVIRMHSAPRSTNGSTMFEDSDIYLIALMGEKQTTVTSKNCPIGAIKTGSGQIEFFKIELNPNLGKVVAHEVIRDADSERVLAEQGHIDRRTIKVTALTPEERYLAVGEFEKASKSLGQE